MDANKVYEVDATIEFDNAVERFVRKKKFVKLPSQVEEFKADLSNGSFGGSPIFHVDEPVSMDVYKVRLQNKDTNESKRDGYRVVYGVLTESTLVIILVIYYKPEQESVADNYILGLIEGYFMNTGNIGVGE